MRAKVTPELLARCLADLESGRLTVEECLAAHPAVAGELRALLEVAHSITPPPPVSPDPAFRRRGRAALLTALAADKDAVTTSPWRRFWRAIGAGRGAPVFASPRMGMRRMGMPALIVALVIALTAAAGGGAVYASQDALPGDALYQVKTTIEGLQLTVAAGDEEKAQTYLDLAAKRIAEIEQASRHGRGSAAGAAAVDFAQDVAQADQHLAQAAAAGRDISGLATRLSEALAKHQQALAAAGERANGHAKAALTAAAEKAEQVLTFAGSQRAPGGRDDDEDATRPVTGTVAAGKAKGRPESTEPTASTVPLTITQAISDVQNLTTDTSISGRSYEGLLAKLKAAQAALARGQTYVAVRTLDAFLGELNAMWRAGHISDENYNPLYGQYSALVSSLNATPKAQATPNEQGQTSGKPEDTAAPAGRSNPRNGQPKGKSQ